MMNLKLLFSSLTVAFAILGITRAIPTDISMPVMFACMAITMLISAKEYKDNGHKRSAVYFLLLGVFLIAVCAYNTASIILGI